MPLAAVVYVLIEMWCVEWHCARRLEMRLTSERVVREKDETMLQTCLLRVSSYVASSAIGWCRVECIVGLQNNICFQSSENRFYCLKATKQMVHGISP